MSKEFHIPVPEMPTEAELRDAFTKRRNNNDLTRLSYWFPKLEAAGIPVPKTLLVEATYEECHNALAMVCDDAEPTKAIHDLVARITEAADHIGWPFFLRTDYTSAKHEWKETCFVANSAQLLRSILGIVQYSENAGLLGLPCDVWIIRELLPTRKFGVFRKYGDMPICKEFRFFVEDICADTLGGPNSVAKILCNHPYWPPEATKQGDALFNSEKAYQELCVLTKYELEMCEDLVTKVSHAVPGAWSVDVVFTEDGNAWVTDMAEASKSYHWEGCPNAPGRK